MSLKILSAEQIKRADAYTIAHEPIASVDLMERAANSFVNWFSGLFGVDKKVVFFCGTGNNGGDGLAIARMLHKQCYAVQVYFLIAENTKQTDDFTINLQRLKAIANVSVETIVEPFPTLDANTIIIDALFGTGLSRPLDGLAAILVNYLNQQTGIKVAVDVPSGMMADSVTDSAIFQADYTYTFQQPKLSMLLPDNGNAAGQMIVGDIGLSKVFIDNEPSQYYYTTIDDIQLKVRQRFSHKGTYGNVLMVAGSYGKVGAAILAAKACLRSGAGLVTINAPSCGYDAIQAALPEAMLVTNGETHATNAVATDNYTCLGIGPGVGVAQETANTLFDFISNVRKPMVIDADALNILAKHNYWLTKIPKGSILTPHPKEFERLFGTSKNAYERLLVLKSKAMQLGLFIVLKGANSAIACPDGSIYFNSSGNAGMATAGSGDVLTGIITALLAQGYEPKQAAIYGVFLHGLAGDLACHAVGVEALIATDMIAHLGAAFAKVHQHLLS